MTVRVPIVGVLGVAVALALSPGAGAATVKVNCSTGGNLQSKINSAPAGSTILIKGTCIGSFIVPTRLTLQGNPTATLDANDTGSVLTTNQPLRLVRLTIRDGSAVNGGGIMAVAGKLTLVRTTVSGNVATTLGGGIAASAPVVLQHSLVSGNKVERSAGGVTVNAGGIAANSLTLTDSAVRYNVAHAIGATNPTYAQGGGIVLITGGLVAVRSHIDHNTARADGPSATAIGGAILQQSAGKLRLTDSTVSKNAAITDALVGSTSVQGGAIYGSTVVAKRTVFAGNRASATGPGSAQLAGGVILVDDPGLSTFTSVRIRDTRVVLQGGTATAADGGAIAILEPAARLAITNSTITGGRMTVSTTSSNAHGFAGAVLSFGTTTLTRSTISGNRVDVSSPTAATAAAGALRSTGKLTVQSSTISGNAMTAVVTSGSATVVGGGIVLDSADSQSTITNSTIAGNTARATTATTGGTSAGAEGGGIYVESSALRLVNATVARNRLTAQGASHFAVGGGIYSSVATLQLRGTLLAGNTAAQAPDCSGPMSSLGYNLFAKMAGCTGLTAKPSDRRNKNAKLGTFGLHGAATRTVALKKGSPALNRIPKTACKVKSDQRGVKRPKEKRCEIGAWERRPS